MSDEEQQLTRTQALMEAVLPECPTLDRLCHARDATPSLTNPGIDNSNGNSNSSNNILTSYEELERRGESSSQQQQQQPQQEKDDSPIAPHTDLSDVSRRIWIVTTAALPWRTGTSVNPLARALYLTDGRPSGHVTLMVPFVPNPKEQMKIFPKDVIFETPAQQETWIRQYCAERVHCPDKADRLNIQFYEATYNPSFASIFPTVDICALVPKEHAHVCILEEPEHLNWMRIVSEEMDPTKVNNNNEKNEKGETKPKKTTPTKENSTQTDAGTSTTGNPNTPTKLDLIEINKLGWQAKFDFVVGILHTNYDAYVRQYGMGAAFLAASALQALSTLCTRAYCHKVIRLSDTLPALNTSKEVTCNVHGVMTEFLQAPPPSIAALSEDEEDENSVTQKESDQACSDKKDDQEEDKDLSPIYFIGKLIWAKGFDKLLDIQELYKSTNGNYFTMDVYGSGPDDQAIQRAFFGRKGILDSIPKVKGGSSPKERTPCTTPDRTAQQIFDAPISLRDQVLLSLAAPSMLDEPQHEPIEVVWDDSEVEPIVAPTLSMEQQLALSSQQKQKPEQIESMDEELKPSSSEDDPVPTSQVSTPAEPASPPTAREVVITPPHTPTPATTLSPMSNLKEAMDFPNPFVILSELSSQFVGTGFFATKAVSKIGQDTVGYGLNALSTEHPQSETNSESGSESESNNEDEKPGTTTSRNSAPTNIGAARSGNADASKGKSGRRLRLFDPIKSRYELRRHPIPARFLGMKDHAVLKEVSKHKIFLNPSESEVLCTTSAEALAMGKFVILPHHPSNAFFFPFTNCLAYENKHDCVAKIQWALEHEPQPLSEHERFQLTWEGANQRLFEASTMTEKQVENWKKNRQASDIDAARLHYETIKRGRGVQRLLHRSILNKKSPTNTPTNHYYSNGSQASSQKDR